MSYLAVLGGVMAIHLAAVVSPGPNFLIVTQTSIRSSRQGGLISALGVATAAAIWSSAALFGISVLFETAAWAYSTLKLLGGAYLIYLGVQSWRHAKEPLLLRAEKPGQTVSRWRYFRSGLVTNLTNPKSAIFFGSIFATMLAPSLPVWVRGAAVGIIVVDAFLWYALMAVVFSTRRAQDLYARAKRPIDRIVGSFFAVLGLRLMLSSR